MFIVDYLYMRHNYKKNLIHYRFIQYESEKNNNDLRIKSLIVFIIG